MTLLTVHPGVSVDDVRANMGWEPRVSESLGRHRRRPRASSD